MNFNKKQIHILKCLSKRKKYISTICIVSVLSKHIVAFFFFFFVYTTYQKVYFWLFLLYVIVVCRCSQSQQQEIKLLHLRAVEDL